MKKFIYLVFDIGRTTQAFTSRKEAERYRLASTCHDCRAKGKPRDCGHYCESFVWKTTYTVGKLKDVLKQNSANINFESGIQ